MKIIYIRELYCTDSWTSWLLILKPLTVFSKCYQCVVKKKLFQLELSNKLIYVLKYIILNIIKLYVFG